MKKVLVMMSTYNGEKYLEEQIKSIINQKECIVSLLVRDDGSTDLTKTILRKYQKNEGIMWYSGDNIKPAKSFSELLFNAPSDYDYYAFSDQDDVWLEDKLIRAISKLEKCYKPAIYCGNAQLVDHKLNVINESINKYEYKPNLAGVICGGGIQGATMVINKELAKYFIGKTVPIQLKMHDYYVGCVCSAISGNIIYDSKPYLLYRQHEKNVLGMNKKITNTISIRLEMLLNKRELYNITETASYILKEYNDFINDENKVILTLISNYKDSFKNRIKLTTIKGIGCGRRNIEITVRLSLLLGRI